MCSISNPWIGYLCEVAFFVKFISGVSTLCIIAILGVGVYGGDKKATKICIIILIVSLLFFIFTPLTNTIIKMAAK